MSFLFINWLEFSYNNKKLKIRKTMLILYFFFFYKVNTFHEMDGDFTKWLNIHL